MAYEAGNVNDADTVAVVKKLVSIEAGEARMIPLNRLRLSALNARKVRDPETIPVLAATIVSSGGLLNPLAVVAEKKRGGKAEAFGVVAGGRRLAALQYLAEHGTIQADEPISCRVVELSDAAGVSLAENVTQEAMHPADQLEAFKKLQDEGKTIGQIAAAFGVSALTVERRLKLANLAPEFIDLFRDNKIEQAQLQALALTDNQEDQRRVWQALSPYERSAYRIGHMLTQEEVSGTSRAARLVGVEAYRAAGGTIRTDLFAEDGDGVYFQDAVLLEKLASEKLEAAAEALRADGWKWAEARNTFERHERGQFSQLSAKRREPTAEERRSMDELQQQADALSARIGELEAITEYDSEADEEGEWTPEQEAEHEFLVPQREALDEMLVTMRASLEEWSPEQKATAGAVLSIDGSGVVQTVYGLVRSEDRAKAAASLTRGGGESAFASAPKPRAEYSAALCQSMTAHRSAAVAAALTQNPKVALASLLHTMILREREPWQDSPLDVRFASNENRIAATAAELGEAPATQLLEQAEVFLEHVPGDSERLFQHLQSMQSDELLGLLARFVGRAYSVQSGEPTRSHGGFDPARGIEAALGIDMADWWSPTASCFLSHVPKSKMVEAVAQACGPEAARPIEKLKRDEARAAAGAALEGKRWLPSTLQPYPVPQAHAAQDTDASAED